MEASQDHGSVNKKWRRVAQLQAEGMGVKERADSSPDAPLSDWSTLSPAEAAERHRVLAEVRAKLVYNMSRAGTLYSIRHWLAGLVLGCLLARRYGVLRQCAWAALAAVVWTQRAPALLNEQPPGAPWCFPIAGSLGNIVQALKSITATSLTVARRCNFKSFSIAFPGGQRALVLMDVRDREYVLRDEWTKFTKNLPPPTPAPGFDELFYEFLGRGIFVIDGAEWREARKVASHMFSFGALRDQMQQVFHRHGMLLVDALGDMADARRGPFDLQDVFQALTFDAICELAFGESPDALAQSLAGKKAPFLVSFDRVQTVLAMRGVQPPVLWKTKRFFNLLDERDAATHVAACKTYVGDIIRRRRQAVDCDERKDLLSLYMQQYAIFLLYGATHTSTDKNALLLYIAAKSLV